MKPEIRKHFDMLGMKAEDLVTGWKGVIVSLSFDLQGCIQVLLSRINNNGDYTSHWMDVCRVKLVSKKPVIPPPNFLSETGMERVARGQKGPADKPTK